MVNVLRSRVIGVATAAPLSWREPQGRGRVTLTGPSPSAPPNFQTSNPLLTLSVASSSHLFPRPFSNVYSGWCSHLKDACVSG